MLKKEQVNKLKYLTLSLAIHIKIRKCQNMLTFVHIINQHICLKPLPLLVYRDKALYK